MNKNKQYQYDKLQKSSMLFMQLGLVLALLIVYLGLEFNSEKKVAILDIPTTEIDQSPMYSMDAIIIERAVNPDEPKKVRVIDPFMDPEIVIDDPQLVETVLPPTDNGPKPNIDNIVEIVEPPKETLVPFVILEEAPVFPGCEGLDSAASKKCFIKKVSKFVNKRFNKDLAEELNITGKQKIYVQFIIDKNGNIVNIQAKAPHKRLEKESIRVVGKLPQMTPGKQRTKPVAVKYTLPIIFQVQ